MSEPFEDLPGERWLRIPGYRGWYEVSNKGRVRSWKKQGQSVDIRDEPRLMKQSVVGKGYRYLTLCQDGESKLTPVHRLVLLAFRGLPLPGFETSHLNGDPGDNRLENLAWETHKVNMVRRDGHGRTCRGEDSAFSILTAEIVLEMRHAANEGATYAQLSRAHNVSHATVVKAVQGTTWAHVGGPLQKPRPRRAPMSEDQVVEIRSRFAAGESLAELTRAFSLGDGTVDDIVYGRHWKDVGGPIAEPGSGKGAGNGRAKVTEAQVLEIRSRRAAGESASALGREYGVSPVSIRNIVKRRTWAHVP